MSNRNLMPVLAQSVQRTTSTELTRQERRSVWPSQLVWNGYAYVWQQPQQQTWQQQTWQQPQQQTWQQQTWQQPQQETWQQQTWQQPQQETWQQQTWQQPQQTWQQPQQTWQQPQQTWQQPQQTWQQADFGIKQDIYGRQRSERSVDCNSQQYYHDESQNDPPGSCWDDCDCNGKRVCRGAVASRTSLYKVKPGTCQGDAAAQSLTPAQLEQKLSRLVHTSDFRNSSGLCHFNGAQPVQPWPGAAPQTCVYDDASLQKGYYCCTNEWIEDARNPRVGHIAGT